MRPEIGVHTADPVRFAAGIGRPAIVAWYQSWQGQNPPDPAWLNTCAQLKAVPFVTWEPWDPRRPRENPFRLDHIARGRYDPYIVRWAQTLGQHRSPVMLRFAHEFNGDWYPWCGQPDDYVEAWQRIQRIFAPVDNVRLVWSPNVIYPGSKPIRGFYPTDLAVDFIGIDGYNWGTPWIEPVDLFAPTIAEIVTFAKRRVFISETACPEDRRKPDWIAALGRVPVDAIVWFDERKERDWRVTSSAESARAFRALLRPPQSGRKTADPAP